MQPLCNRYPALSHVMRAQLVDYPARAGLQPNDINDLQRTSNTNVEYDVISKRYTIVR
jgi:hypothetical protein